MKIATNWNRMYASINLFYSWVFTLKTWLVDSCYQFVSLTIQFQLIIRRHHHQIHSWPTTRNFSLLQTFYDILLFDAILSIGRAWVTNSYDSTPGKLSSESWFIAPLRRLTYLIPESKLANMKKVFKVTRNNRESIKISSFTRSWKGLEISSSERFHV